MNFEKSSMFRKAQYGAVLWCYRKKTEQVGTDIKIGQNEMSVMSSGSIYNGKDGSRAIMIVEDRREYIDIKDWLKRAMKRFSFTYVMQLDRKDGDPITEKDLIKGLGIMEARSYSAKVIRKPVRNKKPSMAVKTILRYIHAYDSRHTLGVIRHMANAGDSDVGSFNAKAFAALRARCRNLLECVAENRDLDESARNRMYIAQATLRKFIDEDTLSDIYAIGMPYYREFWNKSASWFDAEKGKAVINKLKAEAVRRDRVCRKCEVFKERAGAAVNYFWKDPETRCFRCKDNSIKSDVNALFKSRKRELKRKRAVLRRGDLGGEI